MGGKSEERERRQKAGGGGSVVASAAVIPLLRGAAAGGCAKGRSVEKKTEERREREKERKGVPGQHRNSCSSLSGRRKETEGRRIRLQGAAYFCEWSFVGEKKESIREPDFPPSLMIIYVVSRRRRVWK